MREFPSLLSARCHYSADGFSVEEVRASAGGTIWNLQHCLEDFLSHEYSALDDDQKTLLNYEISAKFDEAVSYNGKCQFFSEAEWQCFLNEGFLGVLAMRAPEIQQNEVFAFYFRINKTIRDLEERCRGKEYSDILAEIQSHLIDKEADDYKIWKAIDYTYSSNRFRRSEFIELREKEEINQKEEIGKQDFIESQINELLNQWQCKSLREFFDSHDLNELSDINDLMEFCENEAMGQQYEPIGNGCPLDAVMDLYFKLKPYFEKEHTAEEIGDGVKTVVTTKAMQEALTNITKDIQKEHEAAKVEP